MLRHFFRFDRSQFQPGQATRCAIGFAVPVVGALLLGHAELGVLAGLGALYAGMASFTGIFRARLRLMLTTSFMMAAVTMVGGLVSRHPAEAVAVVGIYATVLALFASTSAAANTVAIQSTGILVVIAGIPGTAANPLGNALLVLGGGLFQTLLLTAVWPMFPHQPERAAVAQVYESLVDFVAALGDGAASAIPNAAPFQHAWDVIDQTEQFASSLAAPRREHLVLRQHLECAEAARAALVGLSRSHAALRGETPDMTAAEDALAQRMAEIASAVRRGAPIPRTDFSVALPIELGGGDAAGDYPRWLNLLGAILASASQVSQQSESSRNATADSTKGQQSWRMAIDRLATLVDSAGLRSLAGRNALRYGISLAVAVWVSHVWGISHAYWLPLTVCLVLRTDYAATLDRGLTRLTGTVLGVVLATGIAHLLHLSPPALIAMMLVGGWFACAFYLSGYTFYSAAITVYVVASLAATGLPDQKTGLERLAATFAGFVLAVSANVLWPTWQAAQVQNVLEDAIRAQLAYGEAVAAMLRGRLGRLDEGLRRRARTLRLEAERVVTAARQEPRWGRPCLPKESEEILARLDENAALMLSLHAEALQEQFLQSSPPAGTIERADAYLRRAEELRERLRRRT